MANTMAHKQYLTFNGLNLTSNLASEVKLTINGTEIDVSTIGSNWKAFDQGQSEATLTVNGVHDDGTATTSLGPIMHGNLNAGGTKLFEYLPAGSVSNKPKFSGNAFLTQYEAGGAVNQRVGFSAAIRVAGSVTMTTVS